MNHIFGVSHLDIPVRSIERAQRLYGAVLGFPVKAKGEGWVDLDSNTVALRLLEVPRVERQISLRVQVSDVPTVHRALVSAGATELYAPLKTPEHEEMSSVRDDDGHVVLVWRPLSEDEYGYLPALPVEGKWRDDAQALLKSLLTAVPSLFRVLARRKIVRLAEELSPRAAVDKHTVVRAYILASSRITRYRLVEPLKKHGIDVEAYQADFDAD